MISDIRRQILLGLPEGKKRVVIDTDTYNEIDDQFALVWALLSDEICVEAIYAAPFLNSRSSALEDRMQKAILKYKRSLSLWTKRISRYFAVPVIS